MSKAKDLEGASAPRKPAAAPGVNDFVRRGTEATSAPSAPGTGRGLVERKGGAPVRRVVAYLEPTLAKRLAVRCAELDTDVSHAIRDAVLQWLSAPKP